MAGRRDTLPPLPDGAVRLDEELVAGYVPIARCDGHKGTFGSLLSVCGSLDYAGAALLAGTAALRTGAGLVTLALPASLQPVLAGRVPELITLGLPEREPYVVDAERGRSAHRGASAHGAAGRSRARADRDATHAWWGCCCGRLGLRPPGSRCGQRCSTPRRSTPLAASADVVDGAAPAAGPHAASRRVRAPRRRSLPRTTDVERCAVRRSRPHAGTRWSCSRAHARWWPHPTAGWPWRLRERRAGHRGHRRRAGRDHRLAAGTGRGAVGGGLPRRPPARHGRRARARAPR